MAGLTYWYTGQLRGYLVQLMALFSQFSWKDGKGEARITPVTTGRPERSVMAITMNNSENVTLTVPQISVYIDGLSVDTTYNLATNYTEEVIVHERQYDASAQQYTGEPGRRYSVERYAPKPFLMTVKVDIWTSNINQKEQLLEQILCATSPVQDLQTSSNAIDWSALTTLKLTNIEYSSRSISSPGVDEIDIASLTYEMPIYINPPVKVKRGNTIQEVVMNLDEMKNLFTSGYFDDGNALARPIITEKNHRIAVDGNTITLLSSSGGEKYDDGSVPSWKRLFDQSGKLYPSFSELYLKASDAKEGKEIVGVIQYTDQPNKLHWTIRPETLPANTLDPIDGIIDPTSVSPGSGLPLAESGRRYIIAVSSATPLFRWNGLTLTAGDIIQYSSGQWHVTHSHTATTTEYLLNNRTGEQLKWDGREWVCAIDGEYHTGWWRYRL